MHSMSYSNEGELGLVSKFMEHITCFYSSHLFLCALAVKQYDTSLVPRPSITANAVEGLVKLLCRTTSGGHLEVWLTAPCMH